MYDSSVSAVPDLGPSPTPDAQSGHPTYYALGKVAGGHKLDLPDKIPLDNLPRAPVIPRLPTTARAAAGSRRRLSIRRLRITRRRMIELAGPLLGPGKIQDTKELLREHEILGTEN